MFVRDLKDGEVLKERGVVCDVAIDYLTWLGEQSIHQTPVVVTAKDKRTVSFETWDQATKWLWHHMNVQLESVKQITLEPGFVGLLPGIKGMSRKVKEAEKERKYENCTEADQRSDLLLTFQQQERMADLVLAATSFGNPLQGLQTLLAIRGMLAMANRGMNWRGLLLSHMYFTEYPNDMLSDKCSIKGLVMKNIRVKGDKESTAPKYTACLPHFNPLFCSIFYLGLSLFYRFLVLKEAMPSLDNPKSWHHFIVLRSMICEHGTTKPVSDNSLLDSVKKLFSDSGVECETNDAATHLGRHQSQVEATKAGVDDRDAERACNYHLGQREKHYNVIVPISWQLNRAGYSWADPQALAVHLRAMILCVHLVDRIIDLMIPSLQRMKVDLMRMNEAIEKLPVKDRPRARKDQKLRSARSLVEFLYNTFRVTIACAATRAKDDAGDLHGIPIYRLFARSPVFSQLQIDGLPFVEHPSFLEFAGKVATMENDTTKNHTPRSSKIAKAVKDTMAPQMEATLKAMKDNTLAIHSEIHRTLQHYGLSPPSTTPPPLPLSSTTPPPPPLPTPSVIAAAARTDTMPRSLALSSSAAAASSIALKLLSVEPSKAKAFADALAHMGDTTECEIMRQSFQAAEDSIRSKILSAPSTSPGGKKRARQEDAAADGQVVIRPFASHKNSIADLWNYYLSDLRPLESKDISWRTGNRQVSDAFRDRLYVFREIARLMHQDGKSEVDSVYHVQQRLDGCKTFTKLLKELQVEQKETLTHLNKVLTETEVYKGVGSQSSW